MRERVLALIQKYLPGEIRSTGEGNVQIRCPFHKGGQEQHPSFSIHLDKGVFNCFTCHQAGGLQTLLHLLRVPRARIDAELASIRPLLERQRQNNKVRQDHFFLNRDPFKADYELPEEILGIYEFCPTTLLDQGFDPGILQEYEIGFDRNNSRIMYPLRDMYGTLAGFSGGATDRSQVPKYHVYQGRRQDVDGRWKKGDFGDWFDEKFPGYHCDNHDFLWNFERVMPRLLSAEPSVCLYVVEGFKAALWMIQSGLLNTVALMGSYISQRQQYMLHRLGCTVILFLDNDEAGRRATFRVGDLLWRPMYGRVKVMPYPKEDLRDTTQPDDYESEALRTLSGGCVPFLDFLNSARKDNTLCL